MVDNTPNSLNTIPLKVVDWYNYGGITRDVEICEFNKPFIKKSKISYILNNELTKAVINAEVSISNPFDTKYETELKFYLNNKCLAEQKILAEGEMVFKFKDIPVDDIDLWDINNGNLYDVKFEIKDDDLYDKIGFRKIETHDKNIYLNNKPVFIKGVNRHEQHPDWGFAVPDNIIKRDVQIIKNLNCNFVRGSHYPNTHILLDYLDREGIMFWSEIPMWGFPEEALNDPVTQARALKMLDEMVEQYYNHPSIVFWGLHNEIATQTEVAYNLTEKMYNLIKSKDTSRLVTYASNRFDTDICYKFADVICINWYYGWYSGNLSDWKKQIGSMRGSLAERGFENKAIILSEFGAAALYGSSTFNNDKWSMQYQSDLVEEVIQDCIKEDGVCGTLVWHYCDAPSDKDIAKANGVNNKGLLDAYRRPKMAYYTVKELYKNI